MLVENFSLINFEVAHSLSVIRKTPIIRKISSNPAIIETKYLVNISFLNWSNISSVYIIHKINIGHVCVCVCVCMILDWNFDILLLKILDELLVLSIFY